MTTPQTTPTTTAPAPVTTPVMTISWSSGGEARIQESDRDIIADAVEAGKLSLPYHCAAGTLQLSLDGYTVWLYGAGGGYIAGEYVPRDTARPRALPATGTVDISRLEPQVQAALMQLLRR